VGTKKEEILSEEIAAETSEKEITQVDNNILSMNELIDKIGLLSENKNPYLVSKEVEEIKSIFYSKLKLEENDKPFVQKDKEKQEEVAVVNKELHPLEIKFKSIFNTYRKIKSDFRKNREREEERNLKTKLSIIEDIDNLAKEEESIKTTFEKFRILQEKWRDTGHVPIKDNNNLWQSYHHHVELFYDYIKLNNDLRDLDFKRNLEEKSAICEKAEALMQESSLNRMHNSLQELHEHWKNVGPVRKELREELWQRFQNTSKQLNKKRNDYFLEKKKQDAKKLKSKAAICSEIDNLTSKNIDSHKNWQKITDQCNNLESKWKELGRLGKEDNKIAWRNLKDSLNIFYQKKNKFYKQKKEDSKQIIANKIVICEKAEALQENTDWKETGKQFIQLQEDWKESGFAYPSQSNKIWERFKKACDTFFKARKMHYKNLEKERESALKEKLSILEKLKSFTKSDNPKEDIKKLKVFSNKWKSIGHVPRNQMTINDEFFTLLDSIFEKLGLSKKDLATEHYKNKINSIQGNKKAMTSEQQFIKGKIDALKKEIAQYENNISFFATGQNTKPLLKKAQKQIDNARNKINEFKEKLQLLNKA
tara:strand:+ start:5849 stop:7627 length:1779 start_codon:yes stop_codon:yes gene_type:complete